MKQEPPFAIQIELTLGCNLNCAFCGIRGIGMGSAKKSAMSFMSLKESTEIAINIKKSGWNPRIEFARRGEPTLNPNFIEIIQTYRQILPNTSLMMSSNGGGLIKDPTRIQQLLDAGLNTLLLEDYQHVKLAQRIQQALPDLELLKYPEDKKANPHRRCRANEKRVVLVEDISKASHGTHSTLNNHGGYAGPPASYMKPCAKPFRELSINYDGTINMCCICWAGEMYCGNATAQPLETIWNNERFDAVRRRLLLGKRDFSICKGCDHPSYRTGLLPDKKGKLRKRYPKPSAKTNAILNDMEAEGTMLTRTKEFKG